MKTRVQVAGGKHGDREGEVWCGDLAPVSGVPGMRITLVNDETDEISVFLFKQVCLEIHVGGDVEQVIYVSKVVTEQEKEILLG